LTKKRDDDKYGDENDRDDRESGHKVGPVASVS
jgi:hypothetical protein